MLRTKDYLDEYGKDNWARLDFYHSVYLFIRFCFVNELWECVYKIPYRRALGLADA